MPEIHDGPESIIAPLAKDRGYRNRGRTWWKAGDDFTVAVNLQMSQWGAFFYINIRMHTGNEPPKQDREIVGFRAEGLMGSDEYDLHRLYDLEGRMGGEARREGLCRLMAELVFPFAERLLRKDSARQAIIEHGLTNELFRLAKKHLGDFPAPNDLHRPLRDPLGLP